MTNKLVAIALIFANFFINFIHDHGKFPRDTSASEDYPIKDSNQSQLIEWKTARW